MLFIYFILMGQTERQTDDQGLIAYGLDIKNIQFLLSTGMPTFSEFIVQYLHDVCILVHLHSSHSCIQCNKYIYD